MSTSVEIIGFGKKDRLWRWDTNRQIRIIPETGATIDEIRFSNIFSETPLKVEPKTNEHGDIVADIPNILLQDIFQIDVQVIMFFNNGKQTIYNTSYKVENRKKPPEYVYTETEIKNYDDLEKRITDLEKGGTGGGNGEPGADGYSPEAKVKETAEGVEITITDKNGTTEATVKNGKDGKDGVDGKTAYQYAQDGGYVGTEEGFAEKLAQENPTKEKFEEEIGKLSEEKLDKTALPEAVNTALAQAKASGDFKGDAFTYEDFTEEQLESLKGAKGDKPVKGTDYFTEADKAELVEEVLENVPSGGSEEKFELINTITIDNDEDISATLNVDSNGNSFQLKKFYAIITNLTLKSTYFCIKINGLHWNQQFSTDNLSTDNVKENRPLRIIFSIISEGFYEFKSTNTKTYDFRHDGEKTGHGGIQSNIPNVSSITFSWGSVTYLGNGTKIELWGVKL